MLECYRRYKVFMAEKISKTIADVLELPPLKKRMPIFLSADAATLAAQYLVEELQKPTPNAPFATINDTHHETLIILEDLFNIIPKDTEQ